MRILTQAGARHFCQSFGASPDSARIEVGKFTQGMNSGRATREGSKPYGDLRDCLLRDSERFIFLGASNFASGLQHMRAASAAWAVVGFYYSSFYSARALLAMNGGWADGEKAWIEVTGANPGSIELTYKRSRHPALGRNEKSHRAFWTIFYSACRSIQRYAPPQHSYALSPVQNSVSWLSDNRNRINYGAESALGLTEELLARFNPADVGNSLPGDVKVFRNIAKSMLANAAQFRTSNGLSTDIQIGGNATLTASIDGLVRSARPEALNDYAITEIETFAA